MFIEVMLISILILQIIGFIYRIIAQRTLMNALVPLFTNALTELSKAVSDDFGKNMKKIAKDVQMFLARQSPGGSHSENPTPKGQGQAMQGGGDMMSTIMNFVSSPMGQDLISRFAPKPPPQ